MEKEKLLDARGTYVMNFVEFAIQYSVDCKLEGTNIMITNIMIVNKALIYYIGGQFLFKEYLTLGTLILFTQYLDEVYTPMTELLNTRVTFIKVRPTSHILYLHY
jgi:ABC-type bacteriocin/lantibiotic exporter with double-glycine peptidase domain